MTLTYDWKITSLRKQDKPSANLEGIIVQTHWECKGTDSANNSGTFSGATPFDPAQVDPEHFTAYADLTETQVLGWIQTVVNDNPGYKAHIDEQIQKQIDAIVRPVTEINADSLPWAPANTTPTANT